MPGKPIPFVGSPQQRSTGTTDQRYVNVLFERIPNDVLREHVVYCLKRPGLSNSTQPSGGAATGRGMYAWGATGKIYSVFNNKVYSGVTDLGVTLAASTGRVWWVEIPVSTGTQLLILSDGADNYNITTADGITQIDETDDAQYPVSNLGSICYLNSGYLIQAQSDGQIWNSDHNVFTSWITTSFLTADSHGGALEAILHMKDQVIALTKNRIEFFFDNGNPVGSPLLRIDQNILYFGIASKNSLASSGEVAIFVSENSSDGDGGRSIHMIVSLGKVVDISNPSINRLLAAEGTNISTCSAWMERVAGQLIYVLNLDGAERTLVYSVDTGLWCEWSAAAAATADTGELWTINGTATLVDNYLSLPGTSGNYASTPDSATISITGDIDIRIDMAMTDWTPSSATAVPLVDKSDGISGYRFVMQSSNFLRLDVFVGGSLRIPTCSALTGFTDGSRHWVRVTRASATGNTNFFTSEAEDGLTWTALGTADVTSTSGTISDNALSLKVGTSDQAGLDLLNGKVYRAQVYNGIGGTLAADFDPENWIDRPTKFNGIAATSLNGVIYIQDATNGRIYTLSNTVYQDSSINPVAALQTTKYNNGSQNRKFERENSIIGDNTTGNMMVSTSDDDYVTFSASRAIDMSITRKEVKRLGSYYERAYRYNYTNNDRMRVQAFVPDVEVGAE